MKTLLKIIATLGIIGATIVSSFAYDLTPRDYKLIDTIEDRIFTLLDDNENIAPEKLVDILKKVEEKNASSERLSEILVTIIDDVEYTYYLGEYSDGAEMTMTREDCYEGEKFDEEDGYCYVEGEEDDSDYGEEYGAPEGENSHSSQEEESIRASYQISGNSITLISGQAGIEDKKIFEIFSTLIPESARKDFKLYKVFNDPNGDTAAHVVQDSDEPNKWNMTVNVDSFYIDGKLDLKESLHTLIHEYSHVLTLGKTQVKYISETATEKEYERAQDTCRAYFLQEGCLHDKAFLHSFIEKFWKQDFATSQNGGENDFYTGREDNFVSDYAATNPGEDIAESFTHFVLNSKPSGSSISDQKVQFFYNYPELVKLRSIIRNRLSQVK